MNNLLLSICTNRARSTIKVSITSDVITCLFYVISELFLVIYRRVSVITVILCKYVAPLSLLNCIYCFLYEYV